MFRFMNSEYLWGLWGVVILALLFFVNRKRIQHRLTQAFGSKMLPFFVARISEAKKNAKFVLSLLCFTLILLALARPQMGKGKLQIKSEGVEVMVAIDVSRSMLVEDVKPSRLEHAKKEIIRLLDMMGGDKVGLLAFAGSAVLLSPMTTDKSALKMFLETLSPNSVETQGTELKKALEESRDAFKRGGEEVGPNQRITRVVVLISDGEDHEEGALKVAGELAKNGTRVFTMAFGTERGGKVPLRDARGVLKGYQKDKTGKEILSKVAGESLRQLARAGKGSFYHVTFGGNHMKLLKEDLDKLEKAEFDSLTSESFDEKFQIPLFFAFLFGLSELMVGTRRRLFGKWKGRFVA